MRRPANGTSQWTSYLWLGGQPVGLVKGNTLYWVSADHLGRPEVATNAAKQVVWRAANKAFERSVSIDQVGGYNLGFPGQYYDTESNLWHNGFRDYEPSIGRYIQSDPIGLAGGISTYGYVGGNPVDSIDPYGLIAYLCQQGNNIGIVIPINFHGATSSQMAKIASSIQKMWSGNIGSYNVKTVVQIYADRPHMATANTIAIGNGMGISYVDLPNNNTGGWYVPGQWSSSALYPHEAGHLMGLGDHGTGMMGDNLNGAKPDAQNMREILDPSNEAIVRGCGCGNK